MSTSRRILLIGGFCLLGSALLIGTPQVQSKVVSESTKDGKTYKLFTGVLANGTLVNGKSAGGPGTLLKYSYPVPIDTIDFICDPRTVNWVIEIQLRDVKMKGKVIIPKTEFISDPKLGPPHFCDHVEVLMEYYAKDSDPPPHGRAVYVKRIP